VADPTQYAPGFAKTCQTVVLHPDCVPVTTDLGTLEWKNLIIKALCLALSFSFIAFGDLISIVALHLGLGIELCAACLLSQLDTTDTMQMQIF